MRVSYKVSIRAQISRAKFRQILRLFALDLTAVQIAELAHLNRNTVNRYLKLIRRQVASFCESESPFTGEVELDESYFGAKRVRGKRGRGAYGKTIVFGIYKRSGSVYTEIVPNCSRKTLYAIVQGKVGEGSTIHTDGFAPMTESSISAIRSTTGSITEGMNSPSGPLISMASKASGALPRSGSSSFADYQRTLSTCISKNASLDLITVTRTFTKSY